MRNRLLGTLAAGLLLVLPVGAAAQEDPCYVDPTSPECIDVGGEGEEVDDGEVDADDGAVDTDDGTEVRGETLGVGGATTTAALPRTGLETGVLLGLVAGLFLVGGVLVFEARRRRAK